MTLNEKCPLGVHEDGVIECACESIPMPSTPIQQNNFMQTDKYWSECGHCKPEKYEKINQFPTEKCPCKCHIQPNREEWEIELEQLKEKKWQSFGISFNDADYLSFIKDQIQRTREETLREVIEIVEIQRIHGDNSRNWGYVNACEDINERVLEYMMSKGIPLSDTITKE